MEKGNVWKLKLKIERVPNQGEDFWIDNICHEVVGVSTIYKGNNSWYYDVILKTK